MAARVSRPKSVNRRRDKRHAPGRTPDDMLTNRFGSVLLKSFPEWAETGPATTERLFVPRGLPKIRDVRGKPERNQEESANCPGR